MDIKVNNVEQSFQPEAVKQVQDAGSDAFRFALMSNIQESELQERLSNLMSEITAEGEVISKRKNIKDMRPTSSADRTSWTRRDVTEYTA